MSRHRRPSTPASASHPRAERHHSTDRRAPAGLRTVAVGIAFVLPLGLFGGVTSTLTGGNPAAEAASRVFSLPASPDAEARADRAAERAGRKERAERSGSTTQSAGTTAAGATAGTTTPATGGTAGATSEPGPQPTQGTATQSATQSATASSSESTTQAAPETAPAPAATGLLEAGQSSQGLIAGGAELASLPMSGAAWNTVLSAARDHSGSVNLADQDSTHAARTLASALVAVRTGDAAQRDHVVSVLRQLPGSSLSGARVLAISRQLGGYAIAADLVGYQDPSFRAWIGGMRTKDVGNHGRWTTISMTSEDSANNWGTWAMATRIAISGYLGDRGDLDRAARVFRGFTGDRSAYAGFKPTNDFDPSWTCGSEWVPINPASCGAKGGAIVEDISRSDGSYPSVDSTGLTYSWEVLGGATLSARLLERAGYRDVWQWSDRALLRAATFLQRNGGYAPEYRVNQYIPHEINAAYGVQLGPVGAVGHGRQFGFTDWLS